MLGARAVVIRIAAATYENGIGIDRGQPFLIFRRQMSKYVECASKREREGKGERAEDCRYIGLLERELINPKAFDSLVKTSGAPFQLQFRFASRFVPRIRVL